MSEKKDDSIKSPNRWKECEGDQILACKTAVKCVKDEFFKALKDKFDIDVKNKNYDTTDNGICLIFCPPSLNGANYYTGLVKLPNDSLFGCVKWASVRVRQNVLVDTNKPEYKLQGFIIGMFKVLNYVRAGQYEFYPIMVFGGPGPAILSKHERQRLKNLLKKMGGPGAPSYPPHIYPRNWKPCIDNKKGIKEMLNSAQIKDSFFKEAEKLGYIPGSSKTYEFTGDAIFCTKDDDQLTSYIALVRLSTIEFSVPPNIKLTFYASIRVECYEGIEDPLIFTVLGGFIISLNPTLQFVRNGVYRFGKEVKPDGKIISVSSDDSKDNKEMQLTFMNSGMDYLPTGEIQKTMDAFKEDIKKKCGIVGDLDTFQVVTATSCGVEYFFTSKQLFFFWQIFGF